MAARARAAHDLALASHAADLDAALARRAAEAAAYDARRRNLYGETKPAAWNAGVALVRTP